MQVVMRIDTVVMNRSLDTIFGHWTQLTAFSMGVACLILSFALYIWQSTSGQLPDAAVWYQTNNHGPWRWKTEGYLVFWPFLVLIPAALLSGIVLASIGYWKGRILPCIVVVASLALMCFLQLRYLFWLVD